MIKTSSQNPTHAPMPAGLLLLAPILAIVLYFSALGAALIHDGARLTATNPQVNGSVGWSQVWSEPTPAPPQGGDVYRPVMGSLLRIQWTLWGLSPSSFHSVNLILWAGVIVFYLLFMSRLVANSLARTVGVLLLVLHPMASQSVYSVAGQGALLSLLSCLAALWIVQTARQGLLSRGWLTGGLAICSLVAFGSHEMGLLLPLWLLIQWLLSSPPARSIEADISIAASEITTKKSRKKSRTVTSHSPMAALNPAWVALPVVAVLGFYLLLRYWAMDSLMPATVLLTEGWPESLGSRLAGGFSVIALAVRRLFWPVAPTQFYSPDYDLTIPAAWIGVMLLALGLALTLLAARRWKTTALALLMTLTPLLALSQWLPLSRFFSEGPLIFALPGLALLAARLTEKAAPGETMLPSSLRGRLIGLTAILILGAMAWQTHTRGKDWKSPDTFWDKEATLHPTNPLPLIRQMELAIQQNQATRLSTLTDQALPLSHPAEIDRIHQLQAGFYGMQDDKKALTGLLDSILASERIYQAGYARSLAAVAQSSGLASQEEALWRRELTVNPEDFDALYRLAEIDSVKGDKTDAVKMSSQAVEHAPQRFKARAMALYGKMLIEDGYLREGAQQLQVALNNDPTMYEPYIYLIRLKWGQKDYKAAERLITQCNLKAHVSSYVDLAILYASMLDEQGKTSQALELMQRWIEIYPNDFQLHLFVARYLVDHKLYVPAKKIYLRLRTLVKGAQLSEVWMGLARVAKLGEGNTPIAIQCLNESLKANPSNEEAQSLLRRFKAGQESESSPALPTGISPIDGTMDMQDSPLGTPAGPQATPEPMPTAEEAPSSDALDLLRLPASPGEP